MRSTLVLLAAAGGFLALLLHAHHKAAHMIADERAVVRELPALWRRGPPGPGEAHGYRFTWTAGGSMPPLLLARPVTRGRDGMRSFATLDGVHLYQRDPVLQNFDVDRPEARRLRISLTAEGKEAHPPPRPAGWIPLQP